MAPSALIAELGRCAATRGELRRTTSGGTAGASKPTERAEARPRTTHRVYDISLAHTYIFACHLTFVVANWGAESSEKKRHPHKQIATAKPFA